MYFYASVLIKFFIVLLKYVFIRRKQFYPEAVIGVKYVVAR